MTELFIDGVQVVLPKTFSVAVKMENPFFTKNGEYTYDVTLELSNAVNAELYKNLNRLNVASEISKRSAVLISDNRVYCNGTEIITGWTENTVSIQLASGNSELNYFIGSDVLVSTLPMKESEVPTPGDRNYAIKRYPDIDYCLASVYDRELDILFNKWALKKLPGEIEYNLVSDGNYWYPQPFLCAYIKEILKSLGYDLQFNQLESTIVKDLYICHVEQTCKWHEMLPGWTVQDFLEEIEKSYNAVFVIDNKKKTARLMIQASYYAGTSTVHVQQVKDVYEVEVEEDPEVNEHASSNIKYNFPDSSYYRWRCLSDVVKKKAKRDVIPASFTNSSGWLARLQAWFSDSRHKLTDTIYTDEVDGREYMYKSERTGSPQWPYFYMLNEFSSIERDDSDKGIELEMIPVELAMNKLQWYSGDSAGAVSDIILPVIDKSDNDSKETTDETLAEMIENNTTEEVENKGKIFLAFFYGKNNPMALAGLKNIYPQPFTDEYIQDAFEQYWLTNSDGATMRLSKYDLLFYQGGYNIDFAKGVKIQSYDPNLFDVRMIFEIRNKRYVCKEIEYTLDADGRKGAWVGTFYPISMSDTEADARWILTDGKWRDGGVWLENGRWLDG